jgi:hypothetical protein
MGAWINEDILFNPVNWIIIALILIFVASGALAIKSNAGALTPKL